MEFFLSFSQGFFVKLQIEVIPIIFLFFISHCKEFSGRLLCARKKLFLWTFFHSWYDICQIYFASDSSVYNFTIDLKVFARRKSTNELSTTLINGCIITFRMAKTRKKIWKTWDFWPRSKLFPHISEGSVEDLVFSPQCNIIRFI